MRQPYVAWSGGKDSLVSLALSAQILPGVTAWWVDDELTDETTPDYVAMPCKRMGARLIVKMGTKQHGSWFRSWHDEPFWRRPHPLAMPERESIRTLAPTLGYDAVVLGLRGDESTQRRAHLRGTGEIAERRHEFVAINPLARWTLADVWAAIADWKLPYNPVYDQLAQAGIPRELQRVGPLPLAPGWVLRETWPDLYRRLVTRYGDRWGG